MRKINKIYLTKEERLALRNYVKSILEEETKNDETSCVYTQCYKDNNQYIFDINIVNYNGISRTEEIPIKGIEKLIIRKVYIPSYYFSFGMMTHVERGYANEVQNSTIILDSGNYYKRLQELSEEFGQKKFPNMVNVQPPLRIRRRTKED